MLGNLTPVKVDWLCFHWCLIYLLYVSLVPGRSNLVATVRNTWRNANDHSELEHDLTPYNAVMLNSMLDVCSFTEISSLKNEIQVGCSFLVKVPTVCTSCLACKSPSFLWQDVWAKYTDMKQITPLLSVYLRRHLFKLWEKKNFGLKHILFV